MNDYLNRVLDFVKSQEDLEFSLGDTLDVKASILLVVVTFLATQSSEFLNRATILAAHWRYAQMFSIGFLIAAGFLALLELRLRKYPARMEPKKFLGWLAEVRDFYATEADPEARIIAWVYTKEIEKSQNRFEQSNVINTRKASMLKWCFRFTLGALGVNLLTLCGLYVGF